MAEADRTAQIIRLSYRDEKRTKAFYEALTGEQLVLGEQMGFPGFIAKVGDVRLMLRPVEAGAVYELKHLSLRIAGVVGAFQRLMVGGFEECIEGNASVRDPGGHQLRIILSYDRLRCLNVGRTEQFYRLLGLSVFYLKDQPGPHLLIDDQLIRLESGVDAERRAFHITYCGPTLSCIDDLNRAGFGPIELNATELVDPDGRQVVLKRRS